MPTWFEVMSANFAVPFAEWRSATVGSIESTSTTTVLRICERRVAVMVGMGMGNRSREVENRSRKDEGWGRGEDSGVRGKETQALGIVD